MAKKQRGGSRPRTQRRQHDQRARAYEQRTESAWHQSRAIRWTLAALAVIAVLVVAGVIIIGVKF